MTMEEDFMSFFKVELCDDAMDPSWTSLRSPDCNGQAGSEGREGQDAQPVQPIQGSDHFANSQPQPYQNMYQSPAGIQVANMVVGMSQMGINQNPILGWGASPAPTAYVYQDGQLADEQTPISSLLNPALVWGPTPDDSQSGRGDLDILKREESPAVPVAAADRPLHPNWTYAVDVWPVEDRPGQHYVSDHNLAVHEALTQKNLPDYRLSVEATNPRNPHRRFTLPRAHRNNERVRLDFLQIFNANRAYNQLLFNYRFRMSVVYEPRSLMHSDSYPTIGDLDHDGTNPGDHVRYTDQDVADLTAYDPPAPTLMPSPEPHHGLVLSSPTPQPTSLPTAMPTPKDDTELRTPQRIKSIPKPDREVIKNEHGKYCCDWPECTEEVKEFNRKCEWNKHMDKHDRPYKCPAEGCEKLPGFTYSGGLLRHEREVHGKHGGPKNPLNCPHPNCKRHSGKGFSRLENLNEHLRRVHTNNPNATGSGGEDLDDNVSVDANEKTVVGEKRKPDDDLRVENKRLRDENSILKEQVEALKRQHIALMAQYSSPLQAADFDNRMSSVPHAPMLDDAHAHF